MLIGRDPKQHWESVMETNPLFKSRSMGGEAQWWVRTDIYIKKQTQTFRGPAPALPDRRAAAVSGGRDVSNIDPRFCGSGNSASSRRLGSTRAEPHPLYNIFPNPAHDSFGNGAGDSLSASIGPGVGQVATHLGKPHNLRAVCVLLCLTSVNTHTHTRVCVLLVLRARCSNKRGDWETEIAELLSYSAVGD